MSKYALLEKYNNWISSNEDAINTYANHLIVIFAFSVPLFISVRRVSISLLIILFLARGRIVHHTRLLLSDPLVSSFIIYFLVHVLWLVGSDDWMSAKKSLHDSAFLLFVPIFVSFIDKKYVKRISGAFVLGMVVSSIVSYGLLFELVSGMQHNISHGVASDPTPLYHHTHYGYMLAITALILLYKIIDSKDMSLNIIIVGALFVLVALNMLIIEGRSGFIIFVVLTFIMMMLHFKSRSAKPIFVTLVLMVVASTLSYSYIDVFKDRFDLTVKSAESVIVDKNYNTSIGGRVGMFVYSMAVISDDFMFGNGTGDHVSVVRKEIEMNDRGMSGLVKSLPHMHNEYISSLVQFGILGLLAFLNIPYQMLRYSTGFNGMVLKFTGISILLYTLIDVLIIGLGMILTVVVISSVSMNKYYVTGANYKMLDIRQAVIYALLILGFYLIKLILP